MGGVKCSRAKISDFGLSRAADQGSRYYFALASKVAVKWQPLEALNRKKYSAQSDIWSFGVALWEIFTGGDEPYAGMSNGEVVKWLGESDSNRFRVCVYISMTEKNDNWNSTSAFQYH